jgi:hypothetical protein
MPLGATEFPWPRLARSSYDNGECMPLGRQPKLVPSAMRENLGLCFPCILNQRKVAFPWMRVTGLAVSTLAFASRESLP